MYHNVISVKEVCTRRPNAKRDAGSRRGQRHDDSELKYAVDRHDVVFQLILRALAALARPIQAIDSEAISFISAPSRGTT